MFRVCGLTPGEYSLFTPEAGHGIATFSVIDSDIHGLRLNIDTEVPDLKVEIVSGDSRSSSTMPLSPSQRPEVIVRLVDGNGESYEKVATVPFSGDSFPVPAGDFAVELTPPLGSYAVWRSRLGGRVDDGLLHLSAGAPQVLRVDVTRGASTVTCTIAAAERSGNAGSAVVLVPDGVVDIATLSIRARQVPSDSRGLARFEALAPGEYRILALRRPFRPVPEDLEKILRAIPDAQRVQVSPGSAIRVDLRE